MLFNYMFYFYFLIHAALDSYLFLCIINVYAMDFFEKFKMKIGIKSIKLSKIYKSIKPAIGHHDSVRVTAFICFKMNAVIH